MIIKIQFGFYLSMNEPGKNKLVLTSQRANKVGSEQAKARTDFGANIRTLLKLVSYYIKNFYKY